MGDRAAAEVIKAEVIKAAMSLLGQSRSEKKLAALAANRYKPPLKPLGEIACNCGGAGVAWDSHKSRCARGRAIRYRIKKGLPLL